MFGSFFCKSAMCDEWIEDIGVLWMEVCLWRNENWCFLYAWERELTVKYWRHGLKWIKVKEWDISKSNNRRNTLELS